MAVLIRPRAWGTQKPGPGSQIDWNHPLAQGLVFATLNNVVPFDLVSNRLPTVRNGSYGLSPLGQYNALNNSGNTAQFTTPEIAQIGALGVATLAAGLVWNGATLGYAGTLSYCDNANTAAGQMNIGGNNNNTYGGWYGNAGYVTMAAPTANTFFLQSNRLRGGNGAIDRWATGQRLSSTTGTAAALTTTGPQIKLSQLRDAGSTLNFPGAVVFGFAWGRYLTDQDLLWLEAEPYAFINPPAPKTVYIIGSTHATVTGTAAIAGTGTVSATGVRVRLGTAAITGTGVVSAAGIRVRLGQATLTGTGTVSSAGIRVRSGTAAISGAGTIGASGTDTHLGQAALSATGAVAATGIRVRSTTAALAGTGTVNATGIRARTGTASISGMGTISAAGTGTHLGTATLAGSGVVNATGARVRLATAALAGTGALNATGTRTAVASGSLAGSGTAAATGLVTHFTTATITASGTLAATGLHIDAGGAAIAGTGTIAAVSLTPHLGPFGSSLHVPLLDSDLRVPVLDSALMVLDGSLLGSSLAVSVLGSDLHVPELESHLVSA